MHCLFAGLFLLTIATGCHTYYKAIGVTPPSRQQAAHHVDSLNLQNRYFVLRNGSDAYYMKNMTLSDDQKSLECVLDTLPPEHKLHLVNGRKGKQQYRRYSPEDLFVLSEVHIYIVKDNKAHAGRYMLPLEQVQKIEVIQKDRKRTTNSYVIGAIGYTLGAAIVVAVIIAALKSSCPFVSGYDGNQFVLQGEIYGGAIYPQLARHDYMPLKLAPLANGRLQLKISNELHERQYTDMASLLVITHDRNSKILADEKGNLYSVADAQSPVAAWLNNKRDVTASLAKNNDNTLLYMDDTSFAGGQNEAVLRFNKPSTAGKSRLILSLKNSYWLDYLYGELAKGFGKYYPTYIKQQRNRPAADLLKWVKEQQIPLEVSVNTSSGWKKVADITTIGPVATREIVVPVDITDATEKFLEIKLSSGFMFWEIDYAGIDYSPGNLFDVKELSPSEAIDERNINVLSFLQKEDRLYLEQPEIGNIATITYNYTPANDQSKMQSFILHTKGYYEHIRNFKGGADKTFLKQFKKPGAFTAFSVQRFQQFKKAELETFTKK